MLRGGEEAPFFLQTKRAQNEVKRTESAEESNQLSSLRKHREWKGSEEK